MRLERLWSGIFAKWLSQKTRANTRGESWSRRRRRCVRIIKYLFALVQSGWLAPVDYISQTKKTDKYENTTVEGPPGWVRRCQLNHSQYDVVYHPGKNEARVSWRRLCYSVPCMNAQAEQSHTRTNRVTALHHFFLNLHHFLPQFASLFPQCDAKPIISLIYGQYITLVCFYLSGETLLSNLNERGWDGPYGIWRGFYLSIASFYSFIFVVSCLSGECVWRRRFWLRWRRFWLRWRRF